MKNTIWRIILSFIAGFTSLVDSTQLLAATATDFNASPPFVTRGADPNVLLNLSIETPMYGAAYNDQYSDDNGDGSIGSGECGGRSGGVGICYSTVNNYLGIFDPSKEYDYDSSAGYFVPVGALNTDHSTKSGGWSGNFLNWATMTAIDEFRWALTGGRRTHDTTNLTVIQRANLPSGYNEGWHPSKRIKASENVAPSSVTPFSNTEIYIYSHGYQFDIGTSKKAHDLAQNLEVSLEVCEKNAGIESNCVAYKTPGGVVYYKPEGLIQKNANRMRFAVMSYALDSSNTRHGGVLRATMKYVGPKLPDGTENSRKEFGTDGIYIVDPDDSVLTGTNKSLTNSGVINYVNKFGTNGYKSLDPVGELFYECLNYFKNRGRTPEYADGLSVAAYDDFPIITDWDDPIQSWCQPNFIVGINDANPWLDKRLPGTYFTASIFNGRSLSGFDYGEPGNADTDYSVTELTNTVGALEGLNGTYQTVGCTANPGDCDLSNNLKLIPGLGEVMGTAPSPQKENSYYVAGLAYYANTHDIRPDLENKQTITTFMIDTQEYSSNPLVGRMNMLWLTGKYGGFDEIDNPDPDNINPSNTGSQLQPNLTAEWDADGDGDPDNYVLATKPDDLINGLSNVFLDISTRASSGTAASVISGSRSGEGALYQSVFYPTYYDLSQNSIAWAGSVHASFVDGYGRMREDSNSNGILDENDDIIIFKKDLLTNELTIEKYSVTDTVQEVTEISLVQATGLAGKYFQINSVSDKFYVWYTVDGSGYDPLPSYDMTGILVALESTDAEVDVAIKTANAISALSYTFTVTTNLSNVIVVTNVTAGAVDDAGSGDSGVTIHVITQGAGESTTLSYTGNSENIDYLWNSNSWLNAITDSDVIVQRSPYASTDQNRYIITFVDADEDGIADTGEQLDFVASSLPSSSQLVDADTIYPYIPVHSDSGSLPSYVNSSSSIAEVTNVTLPSGTLDLKGKYFLLSSGTQDFYVWFRVEKANGAKKGTDPNLSTKTGIKVHIVYNDSDLVVASKTQQTILANSDAASAFSIPVPSTNALTITNLQTGDVADADAGTAGSQGVVVSIPQQGVGGAVASNLVEFLQNQTQRVVNYIRGQDQGETVINSATIPAFRSRRLDLDNNGSLETTWRLGDIVHSSPTLVSKPKEALHLLYNDDSYSQFQAYYNNRRSVVYTGANDGMMHAFNGGFYEDRFDVYPTIPDGSTDAQYLLQPKASDGTVDTSVTDFALGQELWAYIPYNLLPHLYWLTEINYDHVYYVDLKPRIFDAKIFTADADHPGGWGTVLVGGMRFGGGKISIDMDRTDGTLNSNDRTMTSAFYILDITNPENPPTVLGEVTFPHLGYTTCYPTIAAVKSKTTTTPNNWYLVFGSGPAENDGSPGTVAGQSLAKAVSAQTAKLYVVDLLALVQNKTFKALDTSGQMVEITAGTDGYFQDFSSDNNAFISAPATVDYDLDYKSDAIYFGTVSYNAAATVGTSPWGGKLRRIVMHQEGDPATFPMLIDPTDPTEWDGDSVLVDLETNYHQPISSAPTIGVDPYGNNWVFFGTGRYLIRDDGKIQDQEALYGIKEPQSQISAGPPTINANDYSEVFVSELYDSTYVEINTADSSVIGDIGGNVLWSDFVNYVQNNYKGWFHDLIDTGERSLSQSALFGDILTFTTYSPSDDLCEYEGEGWLYGLYYLTGTATPTPVFSSGTTTLYNIKRVSTGKGPPSRPGIHVDSPDDEGDTTAFVQTSDGAIVPVKQDNYGSIRTGKTAWNYKD